MTSVLRLHRVWKSYVAGVDGCSARVWALRGCSLDIARGERIGVVGRRGAGKTTLLRCLAGHLAPDAGRIEATVSARCYLSSLTDLQRLPSGAPPSGILVLLDITSASRGGAAHDSLLAMSRILSPFTAALVIAGLDAASVTPLVDRVTLLEDGRLRELTRVPVRRVAERPPSSNGAAAPTCVQPHPRR